MVFYEEQTFYGLLFASLPAVLSAYFFFVKEKKNVAIALLVFSALLLRLVMISLDPFVHEWDERFHALVAKNMMVNPFKPMLYVHPVFPYDPEMWSNNHIWVHKQPLFLWQMALSMKIFGISTFALRLPSAILGAIMVWLVYDCGRKWIRDDKVAYLAAFLSMFAYQALELTSGWQSLEHNDMIFLFYMTCTYWAFTRYVHSGYSFKWAIWIGVFAGLAILNKWLVGLLIFGGWGLYILISDHRREWRMYRQLADAVLASCLVFGPWQLYILRAFPVESAIAFKHNRLHMTSDLGHEGTAFFHLDFLSVAYHKVLLFFLGIGLLSLIWNKTTDKKISVSFVAMIVVVFGFFSLFVATKMPALVYPVSSLILIIMALGIFSLSRVIFNYMGFTGEYRKQLFLLITLAAGLYSLKPMDIIQQRAVTNSWRNAKIHNVSVFKRLDEDTLSDRIILNCRKYDNIEAMFYKNVTAYISWPQEAVFDSMQQQGYKFSAFEYENNHAPFPKYTVGKSDILIWKEKLR